MLPIEYIIRGMALSRITLVAHLQARLFQPKTISPVYLALETALLTTEITTPVTGILSQSPLLSKTTM